VAIAANGQLDASTLAAGLQARSGLPLHSQLEATLRRLIETGQVKPGMLLPGELELAAQLNVSRHTIRHALGVLTNEGLLRRERGRGTTVVSATPTRVIERSLSSFYAFAWELRARGEQQQSYILERQVVAADPALAEHLETPIGAEIDRIVRLRTADGEPLVLETAHLPRELTREVKAVVLERASIYDELERLHGLHITGARESIRPIVLSRAVARLLHAQVGAAAFSVERTTLSDRGPIEWQQSTVRGDRYLYSVDLPR